jgi:hypothetical protein
VILHVSIPFLLSLNIAMLIGVVQETFSRVTDFTAYDIRSRFLVLSPDEEVLKKVSKYGRRNADFTHEELVKFLRLAELHCSTDVRHGSPSCILKPRYLKCTAEQKEAGCRFFITLVILRVASIMWETLQWAGILSEVDNIPIDTTVTISGVVDFLFTFVSGETLSEDNARELDASASMF